MKNKIKNKHIPVMLEQIVEFIPKDKKINVIDATFGGGGYSRSILKLRKVNKLVAIDRDPISKIFAKDLVNKYQQKFNLVNGCFSDVDKLIEKSLSNKNNLLKFDIIIFDLGLSSNQLNDSTRGFSFEKDGPLDMRMGNSNILASDIVNKYSQKVENIDKPTSFENLEYKGLYDLDKPFRVKSKEAYIQSQEPNIVYMKNMHVILYLSDNRVVEITSLRGRYNKENYNCFFEQDVLATDGEMIITAKNLDLLATENIMKIYNDVNLDNATGLLQADKIDYNFKTKYFKVSMFDDKAIKMKVIQ